MDISRINLFARPERGIVMDDQMQLAVARLIPRAGEIKRWPVDLIQSQYLAIKSLGTLEVRYRNADMLSIWWWPGLEILFDTW